MRTDNNGAVPDFFAPMHPLSMWLRLSVLVVAALLIQPRPHQPEWAVLMILWAAFWLVPIGYQELRRRSSVFETHDSLLSWHFLAVALLTLSFVLDKGKWAASLSLPYVVWNLVVVLRGVKMRFDLPYLMTLAAWGFLLNASIWLFFDRLDYQPLQFSAWIVLLTGAHFHYAGFALTLALALFLQEKPNDMWAKIPSYAVLAGVVLTAMGITMTQLGYSIFIETSAGVLMATAGTFSGFVFVKNSFSQKNPTRTLWFIGGICLLSAMILALLYALRSVVVLPFLDIPFMQAVHGTLNALGFGTLMLLGWVFKK